MAFTDRVFKRVEPIWASYLEHPFVKGIGDGTLDKEKFMHWMKQDYIYLIEYARLFAIGVQKSTDLSMMTTYSELVHGTLNIEMDLHRQYAQKFGIEPEMLEDTKPAATTSAYTSYMLNLAQRGGIENVIAAVLTCTWSYNYIGLKLDEIEGARDHELYGEWIKMYASDEFTQFKEDCIELMNRAAEGKTEAQLQELEDIIVRTSYFEYMFWDMAENMETWPVPTK
ncbi:thiaminase II [Staphylococcus massiliensis CCUG 55927]|uniref:thiaminase II n=1 Tax=Staphylococcus massiliensis TaxID=555791 RepID=UPI00030D7CBD|nr:thiaminase II [Staphylococcus massiliensis]POA01463.1 thiaminase II [Staphylococcus massiliensis CCUG 55927]